MNADFQSATTDNREKSHKSLEKEGSDGLVSFARSGNSPRCYAVQLAQDLVDELYQITITCAELALQAHGDGLQSLASATDNGHN